MLYNWFKIFNATDFAALGLVSRTYTLNLDGIGQKAILVTQGITLGMTYDGIFLSLPAGETKFEFEGLAIYRDESTDDVYLGIEAPDEN